MNLPNKLTMGRIFAIPVFIVVFLMGYRYVATVIFILAAITDMLDGKIARKYNLVTNFGKLMDPFADKVMVLTAMASMAIGNQAIAPVIPWAAVIILLGKELVMVIGGVALLKHGIVVYSSMIGKVAHCVFIASLIASYFHDWFLGACPGWPLTPDLILLWLAVCLTLCALAFYVNQSVKTAKEKGIL